MKLLKFFIIILFLLSLINAGVTSYLSTLRENEKDKRVGLQQAYDEISGRIQSLESEKMELQRQLTDLQFQTEDLKKKVEAERAARVRATNLLRQKEDELKNAQETLRETEKSFANAQRRNRDLEKIINQLEQKLTQAETKAAEAVQRAMDSGVQVRPETGLSARPVPQETASIPSIRFTDSTPSNMEQSLTDTVPESKAVNATKEQKRGGFGSFFSKLFPFGKDEDVADQEVKKDQSPADTAEVKVSPELPSPPNMEQQSPARSTWIPPAPVQDKAQPKEESSLKSETRAKPSIRQMLVPRAPQMMPSNEGPTGTGRTQAPALRKEPPPAQQQKSTPTQAPQAIPQEKPKSAPTRPAPVKSISDEGHVLLVNRQFNFVVVDMGSNRGITMDDILSIKKKGKEVAKVRVEKLFDDYSAAYIIEEQSGISIEEGDLVSEV